MAAQTHKDPDVLETLEEATRRFRLRDPSISNASLAGLLGLECGKGDYMGEPVCCFFADGVYLAAIRTKPDEFVIFHLFQSVGMKMGEIGDKIE